MYKHNTEYLFNNQRHKYTVFEGRLRYMEHIDEIKICLELLSKWCINENK